MQGKSKNLPVSSTIGLHCYGAPRQDDYMWMSQYKTFGSSGILMADLSEQLYRCSLQLRLDRGTAPPPSPSHKPSTARRRADVRATAEGLSGSYGEISNSPEIRAFSR